MLLENEAMDQQNVYGRSDNPHTIDRMDRCEADSNAINETRENQCMYAHLKPSPTNKAVETERANMQKMMRDAALYCNQEGIDFAVFILGDDEGEHATGVDPDKTNDQHTKCCHELDDTIQFCTDAKGAWFTNKQDCGA